MNKKTLATLGLAASMVLGGAKKAPAQESINQNNADISKNLMGVVMQEKTENQENIMSFEDAKKMQERQQLFVEVKIKNDEDYQKLIDEYGQENVEKVMYMIMKNNDIKWAIEKVLEDENIQLALELGDREEIGRIITKYLNRDKDMLTGGFLVIIGGLTVILFKNRKKIKKMEKNVKESSKE